MKRSLLALTLMAALPFAASAADGLSYNYVQGGYQRINSDLDADGWGLKGSVAMAPNFHAFGGFSSMKSDRYVVGNGITAQAKLDNFELGVGYNRAISTRTDFVGTLAYQRGVGKVTTSANIGTGKETFNGYAVEAGVRSAMTPNLEGYALAGYEDAKYVDGGFYGRLGGQLKFAPNWGVVGDLKFVGKDSQIFVGPRLTW